MATNGRIDPNTHMPSRKHPQDAGNTISRSGFTITTRKLPILKAEPIDEMTAKLGIAVPEMIFGDNMVTIEHPKSRFAINFNAFDALDRVDKTGETMLQVAHSEEWQSTRKENHEAINRVIKPFDWSYTTDYKGTISKEGPQFEVSETSIPLELLKRPDPILFFDELVLYEDEMADNGITMLSCKIRVMPERLLLLVRFFMRLDNVLFRVRDTRVFVEFGTGDVLREYVVREEKYETVRQSFNLGREDALAQMRDPNRVAEILPILEKSLDKVAIQE